MTTLKDLADMLNDLVQLEGELDAETYSNTLEGVEGAFEVKAEKCVYAIDALNRRAALMRHQLNTFRHRIATVERNADYLREYLKHNLIAIGKRKLETPAFTLKLRKSERVHIEHEPDIPSQLMRVKKEPDKAAIKKQLKAGEHVPGAHIEVADSLIIEGEQLRGEPEQAAADR